MNGVTKKTAHRPGKTVAIFGGVHGNERVGIEAMRWATTNIEPNQGSIYFVEANPPAIEQNVRMVGKNLNRCFMPGNTGDTFEDQRARELMELLDECDALLDIHSSNSRDTTPFVICEKDSLDLASKLDFSIVSTGWDDLEPGGTDEYMHRQKKPGFCIECGSVFDIGGNLPRAKKSILQFLQYFEIIAPGVPYDTTPQRHIGAYKVAHKKTADLSFVKDFRDFEPLKEDEVFARDGETEYRAEKGDCIIFPRPNTAIGNEAFILGKEV